MEAFAFYATAPLTRVRTLITPINEDFARPPVSPVASGWAAYLCPRRANEPLTVLAGTSKDTFTIQEIVFMAAPLTIAEVAEYNALPTVTVTVGGRPASGSRRTPAVSSGRTNCAAA